MSDFVMPSLGADMTEGTLLEWFVEPGAVVHRGDVVALVDTSKAEIEIEVFEDGVIEELIVQPGELVPVGAPLARIAPAADSAPATHMAPASANGGSTRVAQQIIPVAAPPPEPAPVVVAPRPHAHRPRISPLARRIAADHGIDPATLHGSGSGGAITKVDVEAAFGPHPAAEPVTAPAAAQMAERSAGAIQATAVLMARSKREIPHYYLGLDIDVAHAMEWLGQLNEGRRISDRIFPAALFVKAVALAAREVPDLNGFWKDDGFEASEDVHVGIAISLRGGGIVAPAIRNTDQLPLDEVMSSLRDLVKRTRQGRLRGSEMSSGTLTVTNLGDRGVDYVQGVIYPPQVALVGFGRVRDVPCAVDGLIGIRPLVTATLAADHRASEGHRGSIFLNTIARHLDHPEDL